MSPFPIAHSLVAIGALLAAADAKITEVPPLPGGKCTGVIIDVPLKQAGREEVIKFEFKGDGNEQMHNITNACKILGAEIASETVYVCNEYTDEVMLTFPPKVQAFIVNNKEVLSPVLAACFPYNILEGICGSLTFHIIQKCRFTSALY